MALSLDQEAQVVVMGGNEDDLDPELFASVVGERFCRRDCTPLRRRSAIAEASFELVYVY